MEKMTFCVNETPVEVIKEAAVGDTYFKDNYSGINGTCYKIVKKI